MTEITKPTPTKRPCRKCDETGTYKGPKFAGVCYACKGKGYQDKTDIKRCDSYWRYRNAYPST